jgi:hypothetical protein
MCMRKTCGVFGAIICLLASLCDTFQAAAGARKIVLPSPQLIHCRSASCSQLWKQDSDDGGVVYPAQVLTDFVNGEVVGLTAVYDKSVSAEELRAAISKLYGERFLTVHSDAMSVWRIESEQLAISESDGIDGAKEVIYLKFAPYSGTPGDYPSLVPSAHLDCREKKPWWRIW